MRESFIRLFEWTVPRVLTERFQAIHLIVNYSILALALVLYVAGVVGTWGIALACVPGAICFLISFECLAWQMYEEDYEALVTLILSLR